MKNMIKENLKKLVETKLVGQEGINKRVSELTKQKENLIKQRKEINSKLKNVNAELKKWENEISPNQTTMF